MSIIRKRIIRKSNLGDGSQGEGSDSNSHPKAMDSNVMICLSVNLSVKIENKKQPSRSFVPFVIA